MNRPIDIIVRQGDVGKEMFFLMVGRVEVCGSISGNPVFAIKREGDYFGEIALVLDAPRTAWVRARSYCRIATLTKQKLNDVFLHAPEQKDAILDEIKQLGTVGVGGPKEPEVLSRETISNLARSMTGWRGMLLVIRRFLRRSPSRIQPPLDSPVPER